MSTGAPTPAATVPAGDEPSPRRWLVFGTVAMALFLVGVDGTIVATALRALQDELHAPVTWAGWTITIYALGQVISMPLGGSLCELYGRKQVFLVAAVLFMAASLASGLSDNIYELVAFRGIQALGAGANLPSSTGLVAEAFGRDRDRAIGLTTSVLPIGGIVGPIIGGLFLTYWSWRGIFFVNVPIGIALIVMGIITLPRRTPGTRRLVRLDTVGVGWMTAGLLGLMIGITDLGNAGDFAAPAFWAPTLAGLICAVAFLRHCGAATYPFIPIRFLYGRAFGVMNTFNVLYGAAALGLGALVPLFAQERYHLSELSAGTLLTARAIGMVSVSMLASYALRRTGYRLPMVAGSVLMSVGMVLLVLPSPVTSVYLWMSFAALISGLGMGLAAPASNNAVLDLAPDQTAVISGLRGMFRQIGSIIGVAVSATVVAQATDAGHALGFMFIGFAVLLAASMPLLFRVPAHPGAG